MAKTPAKQVFRLFRILFRHEIAPGKQLFTDAVGEKLRDETVNALKNKGATAIKVVEIGDGKAD